LIFVVKLQLATRTVRCAATAKKSFNELEGLFPRVRLNGPIKGLLFGETTLGQLLWSRDENGPLPRQAEWDEKWGRGEVSQK